MDKIIKKINQDLEQGKLPDCLNFVDEPKEKFDWRMVKYNTFYKDREYIIGQFPKGFETLPAFDKIIDEIIENIDSPLEEMERRQKKNNLEYSDGEGEHNDTSKQQ